MTLDGQPFQLSNGQQLAYSLVPGVHTVTYKVWWRRKKTVEVNAKNISQVESEVLAIKADYLRSVDEFIFQCGTSASTSTNN